MQQAQERKPDAESDSGATDEAKAQAKVLIEDAEKKLVKAKADADKIVKAAQEAAKNGAQTKPSTSSKEALGRNMTHETA
ncbi:hypothetical protein [Rhodococcoides fascians]|nr:hypothetical protein [Rhodococcus fascians]